MFHVILTKRPGSQRHSARSSLSECLTLPHCAECDAILSPASAVCTRCRGVRLDVARCCGDGTVVSWRTVQGDPTTVLAIVELDEGPWLYTLLTQSPRTDAPGPLRVSFQRREVGKRYPVFCLCGDDRGAVQSDVNSGLLKL